MGPWKNRSKPRPSVSSLRTNRQKRGFLFCRLLCFRLPLSIRLLLLLALSSFLIFHWSLLSVDPFAYYSISESSSSSSFSFLHPTDKMQETQDVLSSDYWREQHAQNDRACQFLVNHLQNDGRALFYNFTRPSNGPGMASLTINLLQIAMFMEERWNRTHLIIAEELLDNYRWDATHGLFGGYLHLQQERTCVLGKNSQSSSPAVVLLNNTTTCNYWKVSCPVMEIDANPQGFMFEKARRVTKRYYLQRRPLEPEERQLDDESKRKIRLTRFFHDLSRYAHGKLPGLQLYPHVHDLVQQEKMFLAPEPPGSSATTSSIPTELTVETSQGQMDLAFHIRRGDKVAGARKESHAFNAQEYWDRFVRQHQELSSLEAGGSGNENQKQQHYQFQHCFVATDDYQVVSELQMVLQSPQTSLYPVSTIATGEQPQQQEEENTIIPCQHLWTLTPPNYTSTWQDRHEIIGFLAQMRVLIHAKYFVGSFSSNVGGLVALLRGGHYFHGVETKDSLEDGMKRYTEANRYRRYFDSYAVDWDEWGIL